MNTKLLQQRPLKPAVRYQRTYGYHSFDRRWRDRVETAIRYCLTEEEAEAAIELISVEAERDADKIPQHEDYTLDGLASPDYKAARLELGHVDPLGSWTGDHYYYQKVSLYKP